MISRNSIIQLLERYAPMDAAEELMRARAMDLAASNRKTWHREHYHPGHFTVSGLVMNSRGELLLIFHPKLTKWLQPGGHLETDDRTLYEAVEREIREETGISNLTGLHDGIYDIDIHSIPAFAPSPLHEHFDLRFVYKAADEQPELQHEALQAKWCPLNAIHRLTDDRSMIRTAHKLQQSACLVAAN